MTAPFHRAAALAALTLLAASACKKPSQQAATDAAPVPATDPITQVPFPDGALGELTVSDPETFVKAVATVAHNSDLAASPYAALLASADDEQLKQLLRALDPHAPLSVTFVENSGKIQFVIAARATDPAAARKALTATVQPGDRPSQPLGTTLHSLGEGGFAAAFGDAVLLADSAGALERAGQYTAFRARKVPPAHQLTVRIASSKLAVLAKASGPRSWGQLIPKGLAANVGAQVQPLMLRLLDRVAELGDATIEADAAGEQLTLRGSIPAHGATSDWLAQQAKGDRAPLLSLPKGDVVAFSRVPSELGPLSFALGEVALDTIGFEPAARSEATKQLAALGRVLGRDVGFASRTESGRYEVVGRINVEDPAAAKAALSALSKAVAKRTSTTMKVSVVPYTKFGALGERLDITEGKSTDKDNWAWAIRESTLYVGVCFTCFTSLFDAAIDPGRAESLEKQPPLAAMLSAVPNEGLLLAALHKQGSAFYVSSLKASAAGLDFSGTVPLRWLADGAEHLGIFGGGDDEEDPASP